LSGRLEKEDNLKRKIENRLKNAPHVVEEYYYSLTGSGKSYDTAYRYINYIIAFIDYTFKGKCDEQFYLKVKPVHINKYIVSLRTKEVRGKVERTSDSIRSVTWSALNSFFQFLVPEYIDINPVVNTQRPKMKDNPKVTFLTPDEISKVMCNVEKRAQERFKNRDLCILKLGFSTGLRISAIIQIDIEDIDFENNQIRVTEKGDYDNYVMFGDNLKTQIAMWLKDREKYFSGCNSHALFISQLGQRISDDAVGEMLQKYASGATDKHVTPHVMRHSCATNLYEATGDIYLCSKQLNHKNVSTTQRYAELSKERQKRAANILDGMI
jgi:integrase/recombinase XerC